MFYTKLGLGVKKKKKKYWLYLKKERSNKIVRILFVFLSVPFYNIWRGIFKSCTKTDLLPITPTFKTEKDMFRARYSKKDASDLERNMCKSPVKLTTGV